MSRRTATKRVERAQASDYLTKARGFHADARAVHTVGESGSANSVAVLAVHAAIAYADALSIAAREVKSVSGEHRDAVDVLAGAVRIQTDADRAALKDLRYVLQRKDEVSYTRTLVRVEEAGRLLDRLDAFARWAEARYDELA